MAKELISQQTPWAHRFAQRMQRMESSALRELLKLTQNAEIISFGGGLPAPELFPVEKIREASDIVLSELPMIALQYGTTDGYTPLREMIARHTARYGIEVTADNIMITSGSQQALDLIGKVFINPGDRILVESPTYLGALQAWKAYGADYVEVELDQDGMIVEDLEEAFRSGPKFIYMQPNFHNPTGVTMSLQRRKLLVELAAEYGIPIIEDDPYGQLRYEGEHLPTVSYLDGLYRGPNGPYSGNVIYLSTFSKILAPGLRLGSVIAPKDVIRQMVKAKQGTDLHTSTFNQVLAHQISSGGFIDEHIKVIRKVYSERRDIMLDALEKEMPAGITWTHPQGGLFLWVTLPEGMDTTEIFYEAVKRNVAFVPGKPFYATEGGENSMRLNFSFQTPEKIQIGIARLGACLREFL